MEKSSRPQRIRRHSRRAWPPEDVNDSHRSHGIKRLFTPEIKKMLKEWLIRRRENPYPSREEKKRLAFDTGLTYTQICNWFANWRRKLKNSEREKVKKSWGHLIKHYNTIAKGEQFSISSEDSIWEEREHSGNKKQRPSESDTELEIEDEYEQCADKTHFRKFIKTEPYMRIGVDYNSSYMLGDHVTDTTRTDIMKLNNKNNLSRSYDIDTGIHTALGNGEFQTNKTKYKQKMMEKYWRDVNGGASSDRDYDINSNVMPVVQSASKNGAAELSKWLESAAKFTPDKNNYYIEWNNQKCSNFDQRQRPKTTISTLRHTMTHLNKNADTKMQSEKQQAIGSMIHHKDELDAAEALANFAFNCRQRMLETTSTMQTPINA